MHINEVRIKSRSSLKDKKKTKILQTANICKTQKRNTFFFKKKKREEEQTSDDEAERLFDKIASTDDLVS